MRTEEQRLDCETEHGEEDLAIFPDGQSRSDNTLNPTECMLRDCLRP
jgi:hypothetical protein